MIPAAGLGTRFLPATKVVPKELLPVVDRPALQYIVDEAASCGLRDVLLVTGRGKDAMADHFDSAPELERTLAEKGDTVRLAAIRHSAEVADISTCRQQNPRGLGHAVLCAASHVGDEPFAVLLGDDIVDARDPLLERMLDLQAEHGGIVLAFVDVPREQISRYGSAATEPTGEPDVVKVTALVEKPKPEEAPSTLAVIGRYVLPPEIFEILRSTEPGAKGEIQLTDAMATMVAQGVPVHGVVFTGRRYDTGDPGDYLKAVVEIACDREDVGPAFREWLTGFVGGLS